MHRLMGSFATSVEKTRPKLSSEKYTHIQLTQIADGQILLHCDLSMDDKD